MPRHSVPQASRPSPTQPGSPQVTPTAGHPLQASLLAHIDAQFHDPTLTPRQAAAALRISVRRVHSLLAGTPHSFSRRVAQRRVRCAHERLAQRNASVADVAFACGFSSLATFYRQYAAAFGTSPTRGQHDGESPPRPMTPTEPPCAR